MRRKEARIMGRSPGASGLLNKAVAVYQETPLPVKIFIGGVATAVLTSCGTTNSTPCEILPTDTPDQKGGVCPLTIYSYHPEKILSPEDQAAYKEKYGANITSIFQWIAVNKGSNPENVGDGTVAFSTYSFENGRSMVVFPSANEDYNSGNAEAHEYVSSLFETADGKILQSYNYQDSLNPGNVVSFLTIEYNKPDGVTLEEISMDPSKLGSPKKVIISNPPANESITYNVDSNNPDDKKLLDAIASLTGAGVAHALGGGTAITPPTEGATDIPTPAPIEVAPGEFLSPSQIVGYEARDNSGKLIYIQDTHGVWIKASHEVAVAPATETDWTNLNTRLGSDFVINTDGTITGVEGFNVNQNGEVTFNFDGKGPETYHIGNIKVQEINGVKRLLVAGYAWNSELKSWEVFNPGFPMESPEAQLGWFMEADVANGNWLRWHQRARNADLKALFSEAVRPTTWISIQEKSDRKSDYDFDGRKDVIHYEALWWLSPKLDEAWARGESGFLTKEQFPNRTCQSSAFIVDMNLALFSNDMLNPDGSVTSLPSIIDVPLIWERREVTDIFSTLAEACNVDQATIEAAGGRKSVGLTNTIWPIISFYPDGNVMTWLTEENGQSLKDPAAIERREAAINSNKLEQSASLDLWGAFIAPVESLQYWRIK